jgi:3-methyladenine DNA glycosylase/8-oxoguanine DNA glycosylase
MKLTPAVLAQARRHLRRADPVMARVVEAVGPCRLAVDRRGGPFAALAEAILYQQLAGKAAATIHGRFCALCGRRFPRAEDVARLGDAELRGAGLSRQKIGYLRDLTARAQDGLPLGRLRDLDDERVIETLTEVKGIGRWTAEMFLIFRLGRLDVLPVDDYGVQKGMQRAYRMRSLPKAARMRRVAEAWRPYRSVAAWYLWRVADGAGKLAGEG